MRVVSCSSHSHIVFLSVYFGLVAESIASRAGCQKLHPYMCHAQRRNGLDHVSFRASGKVILAKAHGAFVGLGCSVYFPDGAFGWVR